MKKIRKIISLFLICSFALIISCDNSSQVHEDIIPDPPTVLVKNATLQEYESCDEVSSDIKQVLIAEMENRLKNLEKRCRYVYAPATDDPYGLPDSEMQETSDTGEASYTGTNLVEQGVDEADLIKTDGEFIYAIIDNQVKIVKAWPFDDFREVASINFENQPNGIYLINKKLIIITYQQEYGYEYDYHYINSSYNQNFQVHIYDISKPEAPSLLQTKEFAGEYLDSRRINSTLHLVVNNFISTPELDYTLNIDEDNLPECSDNIVPSDELLQDIERLRQKNIQLIEEHDSLAQVPYMSVSGNDRACAKIYKNTASFGKQFLTLISADINGFLDDIKVSSVLGNGGTAYASQNNIIIASKYNPFEYIYNDEVEPEDATIIHRFSITNDEPQYLGSGAVSGYLVDNNYVGSRNSSRFSMSSFAMSEYEGNLRIASTLGHVSRADDNSSQSMVTIFALANGDMKKVGIVDGLGSGERIYAVRFIKDKGYVVTYKKVDPLYVIDLSNPEEPSLKGELKIPGFSTYLHPYKDNFLIGLGFDSDDQGSFAWTQGLKLSLFDISDPANPLEVNSRIIGSRGTYSAAVEEHHAFTLDVGRSLLALPIDLFVGADGGSEYGTFSYSGVMVLRIDDTGAFSTVEDIKIEEEEMSGYGWNPSNVLRTIIIGSNEDLGVVTLTSTELLLNRVE